MGGHKRSFRSKAECMQEYNFAQMSGKRSNINSSEFPNIMNKYFSSIRYNLASKMPNSAKVFSEYLPNLSDPGSFFFNPVSPLEIENEIMSLNFQSNFRKNYVLSPKIVSRKIQYS